MPTTKQVRVLLWIKLLHTVIWLFFAGCILAIPIAGVQNRFRLATFLTVLVLIECAILVANRWHCPLTDVASRYTDERADNFDIYLPLWLAKWNKTVFGLLFVVGELFVLGRWLALNR